MVEKKIQNAISAVYALNDEIGEDSYIYAFPLFDTILDPIMKENKDYISDVFMPKGENDDVCPYLIARGKTKGGYMVFVFTNGDAMDKLIPAVRNVVAGGEPD